VTLFCDPFNPNPQKFINPLNQEKIKKKKAKKAFFFFYCFSPYPRDNVLLKMPLAKEE
jgi:hypothetical protein